MAYDIPELEPTEIEAGTSLIFTRDYPDYPADTWTLTYHLVSPTEAPITFAATNVNGKHTVNVAYGDTEGWPAGDYEMLGYVSYGTERHKVYTGRITIKPLTSGAESREFRSFAEQMVAKLRVDIQAQTSGITSYSINDRSVTYQNHQERMSALEYWERKVAFERGNYRKKILVNFTSA